MNEKNLELFKNAPVPKAVLANVIPAIISMIMVLIYNLADTFFIGQTKDAYMVAAVSIATPVFLLFMAVGMLFGIGGTSMISRLLGENNHEKAKKVCSFCFWTASAVGILGMLFIWFCMDSLCKLVGSSADTIQHVRTYLSIVAVGVPFLIVSNAYSNILRAEGQANRAMKGMIFGNLANVVLDPIMILLLGWDVAGAAIATVIGNVIAAVYYISYYLRGKSILSINIKRYSAGNHIATGVLAIGIPASVNSILMSFSNIVINNLMVQYGDMAVAGLGVAFKVNMIAVLLLIGMGVGIQPVLGYCYGAGNRERYKAILFFAIKCSLVLSVIMTTISYCGAPGLVRAFLVDSEALELGTSFTRVLIYSGPIIGLLFVFTNAIQSMGAALPALILSISRQGLIFLPVIFIINALTESAVVLVGAQPISDYLSTTLSILLFIGAYKRYFR